MYIRNQIVHIALLLGIGIAIIILHLSMADNRLENIAGDFSERTGFNSVTVPLPSQLELAGEKVPLNLFYVRESLDRELTSNTYWHSNTIMMFKRSHRFFPIIERILKKNGIPEDLKYLALVESGLTVVTSSAGAGGYWQFIPETAKTYGLEINSWVDERNHIEKSTEAACKYLKKSYEEHGNWTMVAASYNGGQGRMKRVVKHQGTNNFYELFLNNETSRYVYRLLAMKLIFEHPEKYGYKIRPEDMYPHIPTKKVEITQSVNNLPQFARDNGINYRMLREMNPWLSDSTIQVKDGKKYTVLIPTGRFNDYDQLIRDDIQNTVRADSSKI